MGLLDLFRRPAPIRDVAALSDFIDERAAFVAQKGIYEYSRARAGHYAKVLFHEPEFQAAADNSRWRAYPLGLAMVSELVEGLLRPVDLSDRNRQLETLRELVISIFDRYPVPASLGASVWSDLRAELMHRLALIGLHARKPAKDVSEPFAESYIALIPIHETLRIPDAPVIRNYLRVTMCNIHDELSQRVDREALVRSLRANSSALASPPIASPAIQGSNSEVR
jgi:hypothetical protein